MRGLSWPFSRFARNGLAKVRHYPPQEKLKGGIDLAGGFSFLDEIDTTGLSRSEIRERGGLASRVKDVLQRRVDPNGHRSSDERL